MKQGNLFERSNRRSNGGSRSEKSSTLYLPDGTCMVCKAKTRVAFVDAKTDRWDCRECKTWGITSYAEPREL